jgi:glycosyltransferase involved in cell wall biosynthesis
LKVTGFTFIRNACKFDYPVVEAIKSILPICDEFVVAVGNSEDETLDIVKAIHPTKIKIIETIWDDSLRKGGRVLAVETDKALAAISADTDWAFYIQGDEVMHEKYLETIKAAMLQWKDAKEVDGLLFKYLHFYGSYDYIGLSTRWYANEIRIVRPGRSIYSYRDAQGFRKGDNEKLRVKEIDAFIYHYGWVKDPRVMQVKQESFHKMWHDDEWVAKNVAKAEAFDYSKVDGLKRFKGTHPQVMLERIAKSNWQFDYEMSFLKVKIKDRFKKLILKTTGIELGYKNYIKI